MHSMHAEGIHNMHINHARNVHKRAVYRHMTCTNHHPSHTHTHTHTHTPASEVQPRLLLRWGRQDLRAEF
jgi:hypothetical protein